MNLIHRYICRSAQWKKTVETRIFPWALKDVDLGSNVLEVVPGPGVTTDLLRTRLPRLTCVQIARTLPNSLPNARRPGPSRSSGTPRPRLPLRMRRLLQPGAF